MVTTFNCLPLEILEQVFIQSQNTEFALVNRCCYYASQSILAQAKFVFNEFGRNNIFQSYCGVPFRYPRLLNNKELVNLLIIDGANITSDHQYIFKIAIKNGWKDTVDLMVNTFNIGHQEQYIEINHMSINFLINLKTKTCRKLYTSNDEVKDIVVRPAIDINSEGNVALKLAVLKNDVATIKILLECHNINLNKEVLNTILPHWVEKNVVSVECHSRVNINSIEDLTSAVVNKERMDSLQCLLLQGLDLKGFYNDALVLSSESNRNDIVVILLNDKEKVRANHIFVLSWACRRKEVQLVYHIFGIANYTQDEVKDMLSLCSKYGCVEIAVFLIGRLAETVDDLAKYLLEACEFGNFEMADFYIKMGADVNFNNGKALTVACQNSYLSIVDLLIQKGVKIDDNNNEPLINACRSGSIEITKRLLENGVDVNKNCPEVVVASCQSNNYELIELMYKSGVDFCVLDKYPELLRTINFRNENVMFLLKKNLGIHKISSEILNTSLVEDNIDVAELLVVNSNKKLKIGRNALIHICKYGNIGNITRVFSRKHKIRYSGKLAITYSCVGGNRQAFEYFATRNSPLPNNISALMQCCFMGKIELLTRLMALGMDITVLNNKLLRFSCRLGNVSIVKFLLESGADIHANNDECLKTATKYQNTNMALLLLKYGANVHVDNEVVLRDAVYYNNIELINMYVRHGANLFVNSFDLLFHAIKAKNVGMFAYLYRYYFEQKGHMVKPVDKSTETPSLLNVADLVYSMCLHALIYSESVVTRQNNEIKLVSDVCRTYSEKYAFYRNSGNFLQDIHDAIQHHNGNAKNASAQLVQEYLRYFSSRAAVSDIFSERANRILKKCMMRYIKSNNIKMLMFTISQVVQNLVVRCDLMYFKCLERGKKLISESLRLTYLRIPPCYMDILEKLDSIGDFIVSYGLGIIYKSKAHRAISSHNKIIGSLDSLIQIIESNKNEKIVSLYEEFILSIKSLNYYQTTINTYMKSSCLAEELYICACKYQNIEAVKIMLGYGVDVGAKSNRALYWACLKGNLSLIRTLVEHGINCNRFNGVARLWASLGKQNDALAMLDALGVSTDVPHHQECSSGGTEI